jgi:hypothetical protein
MLRVKGGPGGPIGAALALTAGGTAAALVLGAPSVGVPALATLATAVVVGCAAWNVWGLGVPATAPWGFYVGALAAFHLGLIVPWTAGLVEAPVWLPTVPPALLERTLLCVLLAFCCLELGLLSGWKGLGPHGVWRGAPLRAQRQPSAFYSGGIAVAALASAAAATNIWWIGIERFLSQSYGYELFATTDSRLLQMGLFWLLPAAALVAFGGARPGVETKGALGLATFVVFVLLWAGDRSGAMSFLGASAAVWTYRRGPLSRRLVLPSVLVLAGLMPMVAAVRQLPRRDVSVAAIGRAAVAASPLAASSEMGSSVRVLIETLRRVPEESPYRRGQSYWGALRRVVPNVGLSTAQDDWNDPETMPPNHWITYVVAPWTYASFGGLGFSAVAEPYLNFGVAGIVGYFLALGWALGRVDVLLVRRPSRRNVVLVAIVLMPLLVTARNDFHNFLRPALWGMAVVVVIEWLHGVRRPVFRPQPRAVAARVRA